MSLTSRLQNAAALDLGDAQSSASPRIWWRHGNRAAGTGGFFYAKAADHGALTAPWSAASLYGDEQGFTTEKLRLVALALRATPFREVATPDGRRVREYATTWQPRMRLHTEVLCLMQGGDLSRLVVWSATGLTGKAIKTLLSDMRRNVVDVASQMASARLPLSAFWTPVQTQRDEAGRVVYTPTRFGSVVTLPALPVKERASEKIIEALLLDDDALARVASLRDDIAQWRSETRVAAASGEATTTAAAMAIEEHDDEL